MVSPWLVWIKLDLSRFMYFYALEPCGFCKEQCKDPAFAYFSKIGNYRTFLVLDPLNSP